MKTVNFFGFPAPFVIAALALSFGACAGTARPSDSKAPILAPVPKMERAPEGIPREAMTADAEAKEAPSPGPDAAASISPRTPAPAPAASAGSPGRSAANAESGLKAGVSDDNAQYNWFMDFLAAHATAWPFRPVPAANRILIRVADGRGNGVPNVAVVMRDQSGAVVDRAKSYSDGQILFTPPSGARGTWSLEAGATTVPFDPAGSRSVEIPLQLERRTQTAVPLDIVFVMDTTGSMGEEIERLKATVDIIRDNLDLATPRPKLRFGLVLYKDRGDQYLVRDWPLTADLEAFRKNLSAANAAGGGDEPEDLESALAAAVAPRMLWNEDGARLVFVVTDAPAQAYSGVAGYDKSAETARASAIKIHAIGTGGLPLPGEYQLRQIAQRTRGRYIFLTYGERGESEGGTAGAVSHHTGSNWTADRLETVIIRLAKEELALMSLSPVSVPSDDWFEAKPAGDRPSDEILDELFGDAIVRLLDYSSAALGASTPAAVLPVSLGAAEADEARAAALRRDAERFGARLLQAAAASKRLRLVERADLQSVLAELELALSAAGEPGAAARLGELLGAEVLIVPTLVPLAAAAQDEVAWELYLKLVRVSTAEILSVSRARIARGLGLK